MQRSAPRSTGRSRAAEDLEVAKTRVARSSEPLVRLPHDALRLGLPSERSSSDDPEPSPTPELLALAGLLLVVAAAGTLVVGVAAREALGRA